jgi:hypothetical protein
MVHKVIVDSTYSQCKLTVRKQLENISNKTCYIIKADFIHIQVAISHQMQI